MTVVTDTSVVLNLCYLRQEALLLDLCGKVIAPPEVQTEFLRLAASDARFQGLVFPAGIEVRAFTRVPPALQGNHTLHPGELAALSLAVELNADAVLTEESPGWATRSVMSGGCWQGESEAAIEG